MHFQGDLVRWAATLLLANLLLLSVCALALSYGNGTLLALPLAAAMLIAG